jgi:hypothetical protein
MIEGLSKEMSNLIMALSFIDISYSFDNRNYLLVYDYIDEILKKIFECKNFHNYCKNIPPFFITSIVKLCIHFNSNHYKCNCIMRKLIYIIFYYIQKTSNIITFYQNTYGIICIEELEKINININSINPVIPRLLKRIIDNIHNYVNDCREYTFQILNKEMVNMPTDLIKIITEFIPNSHVLIINELF